MSDVQIIGLDVGRGYVNAYSEVGKEIMETVFKSVIGDGREDKIDFTTYKSPIFIEHNHVNYFIGTLAEKESYQAIRNSMDSKTTDVVQVLLAAALSKVAVKSKVKLMIGVPYKCYTQSVLKDIIKTYKGKTIEVKNKLDGALKKIFIEDVDIFREGDAALLYAIKGQVNDDKPIGMVNIGFRTMELSFFDKGFNFNDKLSNSVEYGNLSILKMVQDRLSVYKTLNEIDSSDSYEDLKKEAYYFASQGLDQMIEEHWNNKDEMDLYLAGGTSLHLNPSDSFIKLPDAQTATARGLYKYAKMKF